MNCALVSLAWKTGRKIGGSCESKNRKCAVNSAVDNSPSSRSAPVLYPLGVFLHLIAMRE